MFVRIIKNKKLMLILDEVRLSKGKLCPAGLELPARNINREKQPLNLFSIILDPGK